MLIRDFNTLKQTVKIHKSGAWDAFAPFVQDAQRFYIEPYLGVKLIAMLEQLIDSGVPEDTPQEKKDLLDLSIRALGPLSYALAAHESSIGFGDAGHTVARTDTVAPASDEKVKSAKETALYRGWQNLEYLLVFLEENEYKFLDWRASRYIKTPQSKYFRTAIDFQELGMVDISYSRLTYEKLLQLIRRIEMTKVADMIQMNISDPFAKTLSDKLKTLISYIRPYIASRVAELHTSQTTKEQRTLESSDKPEFKAVIRPLYDDLADTGNYYGEQADYWEAKIIELLADEFGIDSSGKLDWNSKEKKLFSDIG
ncbi:hypothetical protein LJC11_05640 [Bacteroidales bacterium OttesenSCG-928-I21]|nr:hypothetical protein [Bacteroidales bacterium OttesenSCG-928-I21]